MPTPAEWIMIAFVVGVIFAVHRLGQIGDALGMLLGGKRSRATSTDETPADNDAP